MGILGAAGVSSSPISVLMRCRPRLRKLGIQSVTCRLVFSDRWSSARPLVLFSYVLSGVAPWRFQKPRPRSIGGLAITKYMTGYEWLSKSVTVAILAGFSSVILVMLLGNRASSIP